MFYVARLIRVTPRNNAVLSTFFRRFFPHPFTRRGRIWMSRPFSYVRIFVSTCARAQPVVPRMKATRTMCKVRENAMPRLALVYGVYSIVPSARSSRP